MNPYPPGQTPSGGQQGSQYGAHPPVQPQAGPPYGPPGHPSPAPYPNPGGHPQAAQAAPAPPYGVGYQAPPPGTYPYGPYGPYGQPYKKAKPGSVTALRVFIFIFASFSTLFTLIFTGLVVTGLFVAGPDEGEYMVLFGVLAIVFAVMGTWQFFLGAKAATPKLWVMWAIIATYSLTALVGVLSFLANLAADTGNQPAIFPIMVSIAMIAGAGANKSYYSGRH